MVRKGISNDNEEEGFPTGIVESEFFQLYSGKRFSGGIVEKRFPSGRVGKQFFNCIIEKQFSNGIGGGGFSMI